MSLKNIVLFTILSILFIACIVAFIQLLKGKETVQKSTSVSSKKNSTVAEVKKDGFTTQEVSKHNNRQSCWSIIDGKVFDLTDWIDLHKGGALRILNICGSDGSVAFNTQHAGKREPNTVLDEYYLGELSQK